MCLDKEMDLVYQGSRTRDKFDVVPIQYKLILDLLRSENSDPIKHIYLPYLKPNKHKKTKSINLSKFSINESRP